MLSASRSKPKPANPFGFAQGTVNCLMLRKYLFRLRSMSALLNHRWLSVAEAEAKKNIFKIITLL